MECSLMPYVVESQAIRAADGVRIGTFRLYVATEERAIQVASELPERTYRAIAPSEMPEKARENMGV